MTNDQILAELDNIAAAFVSQAKGSKQKEEQMEKIAASTVRLLGNVLTNLNDIAEFARENS